MDAKYTEEIPPSNKRSFLIVYITSLLFGLTTYTLVLIWNIDHRGGFSWTSNAILMMNWHPVLLILGLSVFYSQSILIFRIGGKFPKKILKLIHMSMNLIAFILAVIGLHTAFNMRNAFNGTHLYSLHSWIGFVTVLLFAIQFVLGFVTYLFPGLPQRIKAMFMPIHTGCGKAIFLMSLIAICTGMMTKADMVLSNYSELPEEAYVVNFITLFIVTFSGLVLYLVNAPEYKRVPLPTD